jgi:hypothetical protein
MAARNNPTCCDNAILDDSNCRWCRRVLPRLGTFECPLSQLSDTIHLNVRCSAARFDELDTIDTPI